MEREISFIGDDSSFIIKSIYDALSKDGFKCKTIALDPAEMTEMTPTGSYLFLNIDDNALNRRNAISHIKNIWNGDSGQLLIMGYKSDIASVIEYIPADMVGNCFYRPINARDVLDYFSDIAKKEEKVSQKKHILVVDDSGAELRSIKNMLDRDFRISMANSGASAISFLTVNEPDLILLDYDMPVVDGPQVMQMIRSEKRMDKIPIMFLTGKDDRESVESVLALKPQGYLLKSTPQEKLLSFLFGFFEKEKNATANVEG